MKTLLATISVVTVFFSTSGQSTNQKDVVDILNVALRDHKLPTEVIIESIPEISPWINTPFVVIRSDKSMNLDRLEEPSESSHAWIFNYAEIFELQIPYSLVATSITKKNGRLTMGFRSVKYPSKEDGNMTCHSGRIVADKNGDSWTIVSSKLKATKCEIDMFGGKK